MGSIRVGQISVDRNEHQAVVHGFRSIPLTSFMGLPALSLGLILLLLVSSVSHAGAPQEVAFYTYHQKPPYFFRYETEKKKQDHISLYQSFIDLINKAQSDYHVSLKFVPRVRLENDLNSHDLNGAIIGVHPIWFKDKAKTKYLWSRPFMEDQDVIVVKSGKEFPYSNPADLEGRTLSLSRGQYYWGVTERINENKIKEYPTDSELQNLSMVAYNRADATIISELTAIYFFNHEFSHLWFSVLEKPHDKFTRKVLFPKYLSNVYGALNPTIEKVSNSPEWQAILDSWKK